MPIIPVKTYFLEQKLKEVFVPKNSFTTLKHWFPRSNEYLKLYNKVGEKWGWQGRNTIANSELENLLKLKTNWFFLIYYKEEVAGFSELNAIDKETIELKYFGLDEKFVGKGIGKYSLLWTLNKAYDLGYKKITVHTCEYDHPSALEVYKKAGFILKKITTEKEFYSEDFLNQFKSKSFNLKM